MRPVVTRYACPRCGQATQREFRFCPWCGEKLRQALRASGAPEDFVLVVPTTDHPALPATLAAARRQPTLREVETPDGLGYRVSFRRSELVDLAELAALADRLPKRRIYVRGKEVPWDETFGFLPCYLRRQMDADPENHCFGEEGQGTFNLWGCTRANLPFTAKAEWCMWGEFDEGTTRFRFDGVRLKRELRQRLAAVAYCPGLTPDFADSVLEVFPEAVDPRSDRDWVFVQARPGQHGMSVVVPTGFSGKERIMVLGVGPRGRGAAREILGRVSGARRQMRPGPLR